MTNYEETTQFVDFKGGVVQGQFYDTENEKYVVLSLEGEIVEGVDWEQTIMHRDRKGGLLQQRWSTVENRFVVLGPESGGSSGPITTISATNVIETTTKRFVTSDEKSQVTATADEVGSHSERIASIEEELQTIPMTDEKVKLTSTGNAGYLIEFIDGTTLQVVGGKLVVKSLDGLDVTINELNQLQGVTGPIQAQLDALSSITNVSEIVNTENDLPTTVGLGGTTILVRADSTQDNASTFYTSNGTSWEFVNKIDSGLTRDFTTDPINLVTESTGMLPKTRYEKQNAAETPFFDVSGEIVATNMFDAVKEVFQKSKDFRTMVASILGFPFKASDTWEEFETKLNQLNFDFTNNLASKGIVAHTYNTFAEKVAKILAIANITVAGTVKSTSKLNVTAPYTHTITLSSPLKIEEVAASVLQYVGNTSGLVHYTCDYNNTDASNFDSDDSIVYDGFMRIRDKFEYALTEIEPDLFESDEIDFALFTDIGGDATTDVDGLKVTILGLQDINGVSIANGDISLMGVEWLDLITFIMQIVGNGKSLIVVSFDSGLTWQAYNGTEWVIVDVHDKVDFASKGMPKSIVDTLTSAELDIARAGSNFIRFAYYLERPTYADDAKNDKISLSVTMLGKNEAANGVTWGYDETTGELTFNFPQSGTYTINYVDAS